MQRLEKRAELRHRSVAVRANNTDAGQIERIKPVRVGFLHFLRCGQQSVLFRHTFADDYSTAQHSLGKPPTSMSAIRFSLEYCRSRKADRRKRSVPVFSHHLTFPW